MKRVIALLLSAFVLLFVLVACKTNKACPAYGQIKVETIERNV
jgi:hypothetical protein